MIVALRIKTGGLGCRAYVDGYCGRAALVVSGVAAGAAGAGAEARRLPPADAHALASASSRDNNDRMLVSSLVPELLDELDYEALHRAVRLRRRARPFHAASGVGQVGLGLLPLLRRHLIDLPHQPVGWLEHERGLLLERAVRQIRPLCVHERIRGWAPNL